MGWLDAHITDAQWRAMGWNYPAPASQESIRKRQAWADNVFHKAAIRAKIEGGQPLANAVNSAWAAAYGKRP